MADDKTARQDNGDSLTVEGQRFAIVPEWVIDADVGDCAFRLYAVLLRYGQSSGVRMPSRATLARRLRKRSVDTVDRAMKELVAAGAVVVERRRDGRQNLTNRYHVRTSDPGRTRAATSSKQSPSRRNAATGPTGAAIPDRTSAATPAAGTPPDPEFVTQEEPPPTSGGPFSDADYTRLSEACRGLRTRLGLTTGLWATSSIRLACARAVGERGWPAELTERALLAVAADPETRSPMRVAEAGPWWSQEATSDGRTCAAAAGGTDLTLLEAELDALDGQRVGLQQRARELLLAEGVPLTRATVVRRAATLLHEMQADRKEASA